MGKKYKGKCPYCNKDYCGESPNFLHRNCMIKMQREFDIPVSEVDSFLKKWKGNISKARDELSKTIDDRIVEDVVDYTERERKKVLKKKYKSALKEIKTLNQKIDTIMDVKNTPLREIIIRPKFCTHTSEATAFMLAGDWHSEERVDLDSVNGLNEYNLDIATQRVKRFFQHGLRLIEIERNGVKIDNLVLALLGDFFSGYIKDELIEDNFLSPTEAILFNLNLLSSGITFLLREGKFKHIYVPCSYGNHTRTKKERKQYSTEYKNNFEWLMYKFLEREFDNDKRVTFKIANSYLNYIKVYGYDIRIHHGDGTKFWGGVGGLTIPVNKAIAQWNKSHKAYLDVFGHFHTKFDGGNFVCNGSLIGYNAYAIEKKYSYEPPQQMLFLLDKKRGKTITTPILVDEDKSRKALLIND